MTRTPKTPRARVATTFLAIVGLGCAPDPRPEALPDDVADLDDDEPEPEAPEISVAPYTDAQRHLIRVAMALLGRRPTQDELAEVEDDERALEPIVDAYLQ